MKQIKKYSIALLFLFYILDLNAQTDSTKSKVQFKLSLNYNSGLNYYGRTDSLKSSGFFPLAELWFSPDFYINAAPVFVNNKIQSFDYAGTITTLGYQHLSKKWFTSVFIMKPFYKQSSQLIQSALKGQGGVNITFLNNILNITGGADIKYSNKADYGASGGIDHIIRIENPTNVGLVIDPSFTVYAGTQNFTNSYYQKKPGFLILPGTSQQVTNDVQHFNILAYEFSVPFICTKDRWQVLITPAYILPQNLIAVQGRPDLSERGQNMFYGTIGLKRTF